MKDTTIVILAIITLVLAVGGGMWGCPQYNVYSQRQQGEANLAQALYEQKVQVQEAQNKAQAATYLAQAEINRAEGVAKANAIIGDSLKNNEAYLRWLYIENLKEKTGAEVIYIPTEAGLPILEANRLKGTGGQGK